MEKMEDALLEIWREEKQEADPAVDLWKLNCLIYSDRGIWLKYMVYAIHAGSWAIVKRGRVQVRARPQICVNENEILKVGNDPEAADEVEL